MIQGNVRNKIQEEIKELIRFASNFEQVTFQYSKTLEPDETMFGGFFTIKTADPLMSILSYQKISEVVGKFPMYLGIDLAKNLEGDQEVSIIIKETQGFFIPQSTTNKA
ncbi:hypothetical protein [Deinococcus cellulosilyticus]|uniref:Uncharacterized protein n=1 Tax=Deinococcus cellulosilyticus (strain DSM 18568 / NBRC 106333 / KACC 11606 / 5516J-15) TaxID=1223518 RepID=A0A511N2W8_DEIC1|nr:hypothetical protein [Deinococcus cellulosilyticus]GEM47193.1 hypothetical protein DC3_28280 [Deinococcus cellulosilyticus NBRC 106333 = KACC 11606]